MTAQERAVDDAKRADAGATSYALRQLRKTQAFKDLSLVEQEEKLQAKRDEVRLRR